jgi:hypothetical protein
MKILSYSLAVLILLLLAGILTVPYFVGGVFFPVALVVVIVWGTAVVSDFVLS